MTLVSKMLTSHADVIKFSGHGLIIRYVVMRFARARPAFSDQKVAKVTKLLIAQKKGAQCKIRQSGSTFKT